MTASTEPSAPTPTERQSTPITRDDHVTEVVPLTAVDGRPLTLIHIRGRSEPTRGPVVVVHGAGVRAELFRPPVRRSFVDTLLDAGWDVWLLNWRGSIDLDPVPWTLDEVAAYDHPAAVRAVLEATGAESLKAVVHCQGSTSFTIAAISGLLPQVELVVSNAVSLHPVVPQWSKVKLKAMVPVVARMTPYVSASWGEKSAGVLSRAIALMVMATHRECDNTVCRMVSFIYGAGTPALWSHANLNDETHEWLKGEFAEAPLTFFEQMSSSVSDGHLVPVSSIPELPESYVAQAPQTDARFVFLAGDQNRCFLPESQRRSYEFFSRHRPGRDSLHIFPGYGHLDVFLGEHAARDTFPVILEELAR